MNIEHLAENIERVERPCSDRDIGLRDKATMPQEQRCES